MDVKSDPKALRQEQLPERVPRSIWENWPVWSARDEFLSLMDEEAPEVRKDLKEKIAPLLEAALASFGRDPLDNFRVHARNLTPEERDLEGELHEDALRFLEAAVTWFHNGRSDRVPEIVALATALFDCLREYGLFCDWMLETALRTLLAWNEQPSWLQGDEWIQLEPHWRPALSPEEQVLEIKWEWAWEPTSESKVSARRRLRSDANARIDAFLDDGDKLAEARGYVKPRVHRKPSDHLRWLVRYQVVGENFTNIAKSDGLDNPEHTGRKTVRNGVRQAAELVDLQLRESDKGALSDS